MYLLYSAHGTAWPNGHSMYQLLPFGVANGQPHTVHGPVEASQDQPSTPRTSGLVQKHVVGRTCLLGVMVIRVELV